MVKVVLILAALVGLAVCEAPAGVGYDLSQALGGHGAQGGYSGNSGGYGSQQTIVVNHPPRYVLAAPESHQIVEAFTSPAHAYAAPAQSYAASASGYYAAPSSGYYAAPSSGYYAAPATGYAATAHSYAAPALSYARPAHSYATPAHSYAATAHSQYAAPIHSQYVTPIHSQYAIPIQSHHAAPVAYRPQVFNLGAGFSADFGIGGHGHGRYAAAPVVKTSIVKKPVVSLHNYDLQPFKPISAKAVYKEPVYEQTDFDITPSISYGYSYKLVPTHSFGPVHSHHEPVVKAAVVKAPVVAKSHGASFGLDLGFDIGHGHH